LSIANGDKASVELATLLLMTFPGAPSIYYGDEVGLPGELDPDSRRGFPSEEQWDRDLLEYHRQLIALRHAHAALRIGDYRTVFAKGDQYVFARILEDEELLIAVNVDTVPASIVLTPEELGLQTQLDRVLFGHASLEWNQDNRLVLDLAPRSGCIVG
jgi:glycosidase